MSEWGVIDIHGTPYHTVAKRVADFRASSDTDWTIKTTIVDHVPDTYCVVTAEILDPEGRTIATGHAYENANALGYMGASMLEVCETSAVGRALAFAGFAGTQSEIASADEMQRRSPDMPTSRVKANKIMTAIVEKANAEDHWGVLEIWDELGDGDHAQREKQQLWLMGNLDRVNVKKVNASLKIAQDEKNDTPDPNLVDPLPWNPGEKREKDTHREQVRAAKNGV